VSKNWHDDLVSSNRAEIIPLDNGFQLDIELPNLLGHEIMTSDMENLNTFQMFDDTVSE